MAAISFVQLQEEQLNHEDRRTTIRAPTPKKLIREELWEHSAKELCWHCNEPWSREHRYKKGRLLMIKPVEDEDIEPSKERLEIEEEVMEEEPKSIDFMVHALAGYSNPQTIKVGGLLKQQPITILIDTGSTNNFLNNKAATRMALYIEGLGYNKVSYVGITNLPNRLIGDGGYILEVEGSGQGRRTLAAGATLIVGAVGNVATWAAGSNEVVRHGWSGRKRRRCG
ncbi:hypothetical protein BHE74_00012119 [Ensete ventricosum]|nr:hypothetical protein BHE74_00012119 [Ensete ventricosum]